MSGYVVDANGVIWTPDWQWWWDGYGWRPAVPPGSRSHRLDDVVAASRGDGSRWGLAAGIALSWLAAVEIFLATVAGRTHLPRLAATVIIVALSISLGVAVLVAAKVGHISRAALGLDHPRWRDLPPIAGWSALQFVARFAVLLVLLAVVPSLRQGFVSNNPVAGLRDPLTVAAFFLAAAVIAPMCEELVFRGLVLRALMRRLGFVWAAALSAAAFGLAHAYQEPTIGAALLISATLGTFGFVQCLLVRRTARLVPAMGVHATVNSIVLFLALIH